MLLVALPYYAGDFSLAAANLTLIRDLGGVTDFPLLLVTDQTTSHAQRSEMQQLGMSAFKSVEVLNLDNVPSMWPQGPNAMFERTAYHVASAHPALPFLFLEPDVTVTRPTWLRELAAAYQAHGRLFMGAVRDSYGMDAQRRRIVTGKHMVGAGIYPAQFYFQSNIVRYLHVSPALYDSVNRVNNAKGFDISLGDEITLAGCYNSELFSHAWRTSNYRDDSGRIVCDRESPNANFDEPNLRIPALIHGCKDASLIALVRARTGEIQTPSKIGPIMAEIANVVEDQRGIVDPEWEAFQAWKAQQGERAQSARWPLPAIPPTREEQISNIKSLQSDANAVRRLTGLIPALSDGNALRAVDHPPTNGIKFLPEAEAIRQGEHLREVVGIDPNAAHQNLPPRTMETSGLLQHFIPREPTTQAELIAARQAQGGFGDELDNGFGVDLPQGALTQPAPAIQVADIPAAREAEASVASGSEVVAAETLTPTVPDGKYVETWRSKPFPVVAMEGDAAEKTPAVSESDKTEAIKHDIRAGMAHKLLLATHHINAVTAKKLKAEVAQEALATA